MLIKPGYDKNKHQIYKPLNIDKYKGRSYPICRSTWEYSFCKWLDGNEKVLQWESEPLPIPYKDPTNQVINGRIKTRRYFPDFLVKVMSGGEIKTWLIEIKPYKETLPPKRSGRQSTKTVLYEAKTWMVNQAKWKAAEIYCSRRDWIFKILTEKSLF